MIDKTNVEISYVEFDPTLAIKMDNRGPDLLVSKVFIFRCTDFSETFVTVLYNFGRVWN